MKSSCVSKSCIGKANYKKIEIKFQNKGAVLVQIAPLFIQMAPLFISQPHSHDQSILVPVFESRVFMSFIRIREIAAYYTVCGLLLMEYYRTFRQVCE